MFLVSRTTDTLWPIPASALTRLKNIKTDSSFSNLFRILWEDVGLFGGVGMCPEFQKGVSDPAELKLQVTVSHLK